MLTGNVSGFSARRNRNRRNKVRPKILLLFGLVIIIPVIILVFQNSGLGRSEDNTDLEVALPVLWELQRYETINEIADMRLELNPMDAEALVFNGLAYYYRAVSKFSPEEQLPLYRQAIKNLRKAELIARNPYIKEIYYILGKTYYSKGVFYADSALYYLTKASESGFMAPDLHEYTGLALYALGHYQKALESFLAAQKSNPTPMTNMVIGQIYVALEQYENARYHLLAAIENTDDYNVSQKGRSLLGKLFFELGDYEKAVSYYREILEINPRSSDAYYHLGVIYDTMNQKVQARAQWRRALEIEPSHHGSLIKLYN